MAKINLRMAVSLAMIVLGVHAAHAQPSPALIEARRHMLDAEINAVTFRSMDSLFDTLEVATVGQPWHLAESPTELSFTYAFDGAEYPADEFAERTYTNALLIVKHGQVVYERYFNSTDERSHFMSMSVAKSITSTLVGMAIDDGHIASVDDPIVQYVPELEGSGYDGVTIRQALMMRSGVDWNERYDFGRNSPMQQLHDAAVVENRIRFAEPAARLDRSNEPGTTFNYSTVETAVLGLVLEAAVGQPLNEYMSERWWRRAGMQARGFWIADGPPGVGKAINGMGFNATLRDYARFGLMMLNDGAANGRQIVSPEWVRQATAPDGTEPVAEGQTRGYQYQWWTLTDSDAYLAIGLQGQYVYVDPATSTVAVKLSYFPPGEQRADLETEAFLRALSAWTPAGLAATSEPAPGDESARHPMDALTAGEIRSAVEILESAGRIETSAQFATVTLAESDKADVRSWRPGRPFARRAFVAVRQEQRLFEAIVDLGSRTVERWEEVPGRQPRLFAAEFDVREALWESDQWRDSMQARGYSSDAEVFCAPLTVGPTEEDRRLLNVPCYDVTERDALVFARPIEGLMAVVDVDAREVVSVVDLGAVPTPPDRPDLRYESSARYRSPSEPVEIVTPNGSNVEIDGSVFRWDNWSFHLRVDQRVGPVVSLVAYDDMGSPREVFYQIAVSEMYVPYMDPAATWSFKAYMDVGEYGFGLLASALVPGADCPSSAHYLDATIADDAGRPLVLENSVCVFERPTGGPLWRHVGEGRSESRANTELVVRMAPVVGNYDYIIDFVFDRAGDIVVRAGAAGIDAVKAVAARSLADPTAEADTAYGTLIGRGLVGINHDHYISFRLDTDIDGTANRAVFDRVEMQDLPRRSPRRSIWSVESQTLTEEGPLARGLDEGYLRIEGERRNSLGYRAAYQLYPGHNTTSLLSPEDPIQRRAEWSRHPVWLTRHHLDELYASGPYPNQNDRVDGLMQWTRAREGIDDEDLVLWYNVGFRHITRAEDWPAMPTVWHSFRLRPFNFFNSSPAMDVPR